MNQLEAVTRLVVRRPALTGRRTTYLASIRLWSPNGFIVDLSPNTLSLRVQNERGVGFHFVWGNANGTYITLGGSKRWVKTEDTRPHQVTLDSPSSGVRARLRAGGRIPRPPSTAVAALFRCCTPSGGSRQPGGCAASICCWRHHRCHRLPTSDAPSGWPPDQPLHRPRSGIEW